MNGTEWRNPPTYLTRRDVLHFIWVLAFMIELSRANTRLGRIATALESIAISAHAGAVPLNLESDPLSK